MSKNFTPGPWAVFHDHPDAETAKLLALIRPANSKGYDEHDDVASVYVIEQPERAANARLIASAPELLAALLRMLDAFYEDPMGADYHAAVEQAYQAIAKATGEQQ